MSIKEYQHLEAICLKLDRKKNPFAQLTNKTPKSNANRIKQEIKYFLKAVSDIKSEGTPVAQKYLQPFLSYFDLSLLLHFQFLTMFFPHSDLSQPFIWKEYSSKHLDIDTSFSVEAILGNLVNNLLTIRSLITSGTDNLARILLRYYVEIADLTIGITGDLDIFEAYMAPMESFEKAYDNWKTNLTPSKIQKKIVTIEQNLGLTQDMIIETKQLRKTTYEWLSLFSHGNRATIAMGHMMRGITEEDSVRPSIGGLISHASKGTLKKAVLYSWFFLITLQKLLREKHDWHPKANNKSDIWLLYLMDVFKYSTFSLYSKELREL